MQSQDWFTNRMDLTDPRNPKYNPAMKPYDAYKLAAIAHGAVGQKRADGVTPYILHPMRVANLTDHFDRTHELKSPSVQVAFDRQVAAYLHDVLEDTKLTRADLLNFGVSHEQLDIVERLTKPDDGPAPQSYYQRISESDSAMVVKCADRCANLEDALKELLVEEPQTPRRWAKYVDKTYNDVLPLYHLYPGLRSELMTRLEQIADALPASLERRAAVVERQRQSAKLS